MQNCERERRNETRNERVGFDLWFQRGMVRGDEEGRTSERDSTAAGAGRWLTHLSTPEVEKRIRGLLKVQTEQLLGGYRKVGPAVPGNHEMRIPLPQRLSNHRGP